MGFRPNATIISYILISVIVSIAGFFVIKEVVDRILSISNEAKLIAAGDISRSLKIDREDEVGDLERSLNELTIRIRSNMDELRNYGERTTQINMEIQRRVLVLSSLLQISSLISQGSKLEDILKLTAEKARLLADSEVAYLLYREENETAFYVKTSEGVNAGYLLGIRIDAEDSLYVKINDSTSPFVLDEKNTLPDELMASFNEKFRLKNNLGIPVYLRGRVIGMLGIGNNRDKFFYMQDDFELLDIFAKQVSIAVENDMLMHRVEKLEIKDALTGLYNEAFIRSRLQEEIKRAIMYRRPCAFVLVNIDDFQKAHGTFGLLYSEGVLKKVASLIRESITEIDRAGRFGDNEFAIVFPEKNKRQANELAEGIRRKIEAEFAKEDDPAKRITVSAGVSENPLDGVEAIELITKSKECLNIAKKQGKNQVIG